MKMDSQKTLKRLSIVVIILAILGTIAGILAAVTGGAVMWSGVEVAEVGGAGGISAEDAELYAGGGLVALLIGVAFVLAGIVDLVIGFLGLGVAKNGRKVNLYIGVCVFGLIVNALIVVSDIMQGVFSIGSLILPLVIAFALYLALDIKKKLA